MATKTFEELKQLAIQIRDEKTNKQNTATRIGTQMLEHLNKLEQDYYDKTATDEELKQRDEKLTELSSNLNSIKSSLLNPISKKENYTPTNYEGDYIELKQVKGHRYRISFQTNSPLNQESFYIQLWNKPDQTSLNKNFGNVFGTNDTSKELIFEFEAVSDELVYIRLGYYKSGGFETNIFASYYLFDLNEKEYSIDDLSSFIYANITQYDVINDDELTVALEENKILLSNGETKEFVGYYTSDFINNDDALNKYVSFSATRVSRSFCNVCYYHRGRFVYGFNFIGVKTITIPQFFSVRICSQDLSNNIKIGYELELNNLEINSIKSSLLNPISKKENYTPTNYEGDYIELKQVKGHRYRISFQTNSPLNQESFYIQLWNKPDQTSLNKNFGNVFGTNDTSKELIFEFEAVSDELVYIRLGYYKPSGFEANIFASYYLLDLNDKALQRLYRPRPLEGMKISWYGTSIPAQGYPQRVGYLTGAIVTNECQGSSSCRRGAKTTEYGSDPYRIKGLSWPVPVYGLMMSAVERDSIFSNWKEYADTWGGVYEGEEGAPTNSKPADINDGQHESLKSLLRDLCYDVRVARHCGINHKYNTKDVDVSDLYVIEHCYNDVQSMFKDAENDFMQIPSDPYDVNSVIGSINALIKYIYEKNSRALICLISHYECEKETGSHCKKAIEIVSDFWKIPLLKLYDISGISQKIIQSQGYWGIDYKWNKSGFTFTSSGENWTSNNRAFMYQMVTGPSCSGSISGNNITGTNASELKERLGITEGNGNAIWHPTRQMQILMDDLHPLTEDAKNYFAKLITKFLISNFSN